MGNSASDFAGGELTGPPGAGVTIAQDQQTCTIQVSIGLVDHAVYMEKRERKRPLLEV